MQMKFFPAAVAIAVPQRWQKNERSHWEYRRLPVRAFAEH
jgi:hypothetical protein